MTMRLCDTLQHELYRAWVPLMDDEDKEDVGVQVGLIHITL
jgi:hypothetical protein